MVESMKMAVFGDVLNICCLYHQGNDGSSKYL